MIQDNASFTFLHRIEEVELNIEDGRWQSALALVLTLPDICGGAFCGAQWPLVRWPVATKRR